MYAKPYFYDLTIHFNQLLLLTLNQLTETSLFFTGMHKKSVETTAAKTDANHESMDMDVKNEGSENATTTTTPTTTTPTTHEQIRRPNSPEEPASATKIIENASSDEIAPTSPMLGLAESSPVENNNEIDDPDKLRSESIASLRAKALEHSAKLNLFPDADATAVTTITTTAAASSGNGLVLHDQPPPPSHPPHQIGNHGNQTTPTSHRVEDMLNHPSPSNSPKSNNFDTNMDSQMVPLRREPEYH